LETKGGRILAISVDAPEESREVRRKDKLNFPILADVDGRVMRTLGLVHENGGPNGQDIAIPAQILLRQDGSIAWQYVSRRVQDRANPTETLAVVNALTP